MTLLSLSQVQDRYPDGVVSENFGCFYFMDQDNDLGYFIQYKGKYEPEPQYVEWETLSDEECQEIRDEVLNLWATGKGTKR